MTESEKTLATFQTRVRDLIRRFQELKKENEELYAMVEEGERRYKLLEEKLAQQERDYQSLKMAKMIEITDGDLEGAKDRVARLIREVNKCIALLSDEKSDNPTQDKEMPM
jgi:uncharacterized coiled-coil protein SlyX